MKIALSYPGCHRRGGIERVVLECANFLATRGHDVNLITSVWDADFLDPKVRVLPIKIPLKGSVARLLTFSRESPKILASISPKVQVHGAFGVESPPGGVMWVPSVHKAWIEASAKQRDWKGRLRQKANLQHPVVLAMERERFGNRTYRRLIALTEQVKSDLVRLYDVPSDDIAVLSNGYSPTEFNRAQVSALRPEMRRKLGYGDGDKVVVFVANELERKGFLPLLNAIAMLNNPDISLLAVGRLDADRYAAEIAKLGMTSRVKFTGPSNDVGIFYAAADLFALPTQYEAWGLVIVEALACGLPVVTSRLAGAAIAVHEGETGYLLDNPSDSEEISAKLQHLMDGKSICPDDIERSVMHYSWANVLLEYERHLQECAE